MMHIGDIAERMGLTTRTVRYYEELGLIAPSSRTQGGFRLYSDADVRRLRFIQDLKSLGFDLERICELFALKDGRRTGGELSSAMRGELQQQRRLIEERLGHYQRMLEKNGRALTILDGCLDCGMDDHHRCVLFRRHPEVPEAVPCDRWGRASELLTLPTASD